MALNNIQYDALIREYNKKQLQNEHDRQQRIQYAYAKIPRLQEIDQEISHCSVLCGKNMLNDEAADRQMIERLKSELSSLREEKSMLLKSHDLPSNYLELWYSCPDCQDSGYIENRKCHCFEQASTRLLYAHSNLQDILEKENFSNFRFDYYPDRDPDPLTGLTPLDTAKKAVTTGKLFVKNFDKDYQNLLIYGNVGVGKTFLSNCIARELLDAGYLVVYFSAFDLFDRLAKHTFSSGTESLDIQQTIFDCDLLIIDDLGTELTNSFIASQLFLCVNERNNRKKSTIISTNLSLGAIQELYSERTFSRISSNYTLLKLSGDDIRLKKKLTSIV